MMELSILNEMSESFATQHSDSETPFFKSDILEGMLEEDEESSCCAFREKKRVGKSRFFI